METEFIGYHGTNEVFDKFDLSKTGYTGFYFSPVKDHYVINTSKYIITVKLRITNPAPHDVVREVSSKSGGGNPNKITYDKLRSMGYDGIIRPIEYVVFDENQIEIVSTEKNTSLTESLMFKSFVESLSRKGNETLIETILEGHSILFESDIRLRLNDKTVQNIIRTHTIPEMVHYNWDKLVFGFKNESTINIPINKINIKYPGDMSNVDGFDMKKYFENTPLEKLPPIEVSYEKGKFWLEDGHHRYGYAKEMGIDTVDVVVEIKDNPFNYTDFDIDILAKSKKSLVESIIESEEFDKLQKNKIPLTEEERKKVFKEDAVWHNGTSIDPNTGKKVKKNSAVWKSKNPKTGKITYVTATHRAYNTAKSLKAIINKYHNCIKGTA